MSTILVKSERCKECGLCVVHCPKKCISVSKEINLAGYYPTIVDKSICICCGTCYAMCPDGVYEIQDDA